MAYFEAKLLPINIGYDVVIEIGYVAMETAIKVTAYHSLVSFPKLCCI